MRNRNFEARRAWWCWLHRGRHSLPIREGFEAMLIDSLVRLGLEPPLGTDALRAIAIADGIPPERQGDG